MPRLGLSQLGLQALDLLISLRYLFPHALLHLLMHRVDALRVPLALLLDPGLQLLFLSFIELSELFERLLTSELSLAKLFLVSGCRGLEIVLETLERLLLFGFALSQGLETLALQGTDTLCERGTARLKLLDLGR